MITIQCNIQYTSQHWRFIIKIKHYSKCGSLKTFMQLQKFNATGNGILLKLIIK